MSELYPTKTRLALLQAVADGAVTEQYPILPERQYAQIDRIGAGWTSAGNLLGGGRRYQRVTARMEELYRAGWVRLGEREDPSWYKSPRRFEITDAGRKVLEANGPAVTP